MSFLLLPPPPPRKEIHPLFNQVILERIFSYLEVTSLKNIRGVCKIWNRIGSPYLQNKSEVVLIRGKELDKRKHSYRNFIKYIDDIERDEIFFRNYHIEHWILNERREKSLIKFWSKCGPSMKGLYLKDIIFYEVEMIRNVLYYWTPNLESLTFRDCLFYSIINENIPSHCEDYSNPEDFDEDYIFFDYYDYVTVEQLKKIDRDFNIPINGKLSKLAYEQLEEESFPLDWEEIFCTFSNLKGHIWLQTEFYKVWINLCKDLEVASSTPQEQLSDILSGLNAANSVSKCCEIELLSFSKSSNDEKKSKLCVENFEKLCSLNSLYRLKSLELTINLNITAEDLLSVLSKYSKAIKNLTIHRETDSEDKNPLNLFAKNRTLTFPNMECLKASLSIFGESVFNDLEGSMPALKTLEVWNSSEDDFQWETSVDSRMEVTAPSIDIETSFIRMKQNSLIEEFSCGYLITSPETFLNLSNCFTKLKILEASLTDEQIRIVFQNMTGLEEMKVCDRHLSDAGITGNPVLLEDSLEWSPNIQREFPYIGDLKNLKRFTLNYWKYNNITDTSVYHGFLDVANLTYLHLTRTEITEAALQDLTFKSSLITLISPSITKGDRQNNLVNTQPSCVFEIAQPSSFLWGPPNISFYSGRL